MGTKHFHVEYSGAHKGWTFFVAFADKGAAVAQARDLADQFPLYSYRVWDIWKNVLVETFHGARAA